MTLRSDVTGFFRSLGVLAVLPVCLAYGLCATIVLGSRRRAIDAMVVFWYRVGSWLAGVRYHFDHEERIDAARPAVYLFNHQSALDILIICRVLRRGFTGVAKKELRSHPILGLPMVFAGAVFIDRSDRESAVQTLKRAAERVRAGLSIVVAPEGTRIGSGLGEFKKGGFRLAMAAGVPLVIVAILNAREMLPRKGLILRPGTVRISVGEPIDTRDWTVESLSERIDAVRAKFLDALD